MEIESKPEIGRKLNYLLVMPVIACSAGTGYSLPLGIVYVSSSLKKAGFQHSLTP